MGALEALIEGGAPAGLPVVRAGSVGSRPLRAVRRRFATLAAGHAGRFTARTVHRPSCACSTVRDRGATSKRQNAWAGASNARTSAARIDPACVTATVRAPSSARASSQPPTRSSSASSDSPP